MKLHRLMVSLLMACVSLCASAKPQLPEFELSWKSVSVDGGKFTVFTLFCDSRGIMWLGTNSGLFFYNGLAQWSSNAKSFLPIKANTKVHPHSASLFINCLLESEDGENIYIGGERFCTDIPQS